MFPEEQIALKVYNITRWNGEGNKKGKDSKMLAIMELLAMSTEWTWVYRDSLH